MALVGGTRKKQQSSGVAAGSLEPLKPQQRVEENSVGDKSMIGDRALCVYVRRGWGVGGKGNGLIPVHMSRRPLP